MPSTPVSVFWFRRDLRLDDNAGLYHALKSGLAVVPLFIFDKNILEQLNDRNDKRVIFIHRELERLNNELKAYGSALVVKYDTPLDAWNKILNDYTVEKVFTNHDYEPYAIQRDKEVHELLNARSISFQTFKDQVIFEGGEILKDDGTPYTVFTPYSKKWKAKLTPFYYRSYPTLSYANNFYKSQPLDIPSLKSIGFEDSDVSFPERVAKRDIILHYGERRDFPAMNGTSKLSVHLRFGTLSIRKLFKYSMNLNERYVNELIWREFYQQILFHFPHVVHRSFKPEYDLIQWDNNESHFKAWCEGKTGYPLVDAGMRELNATGYMHNRVRMVVASFLTKHLLIDWRWGEAYFAEKLLDFELASNNGGWQWAAGSGTDAAPYFRVFNPQLQMEKFDPDLEYVRKWVPEYGSDTYTAAIIAHDQARERVMKTYQAALKP